MYYEINVSLNGRHFFATTKRSIENSLALVTVYSVFENKFPKNEGYQLMVTRYDTVGTFVKVDTANRQVSELDYIPS